RWLADRARRCEVRLPDKGREDAHASSAEEKVTGSVEFTAAQTKCGGFLLGRMHQFEDVVVGNDNYKQNEECEAGHGEIEDHARRDRAAQHGLYCNNKQAAAVEARDRNKIDDREVYRNERHQNSTRSKPLLEFGLAKRAESFGGRLRNIPTQYRTFSKSLKRIKFERAYVIKLNADHLFICDHT